MLLPVGVALEHVRQQERLAVRSEINGKVHRAYFPATEEGLKEASALAASIRREKKEYGQKFGAIADAEKRAIELWREYRDECMREGCAYKSMPEVMSIALEQVRPKSITPLFPDVVREYLLMMQKKNISEEHLKKRGHKARCISAAFAGVRAGNITPEQIQAFVDSLTGRDGKKAAPRTRQDYLGFIQHVFSFAVKRGIVASNPAKALDKPKVTPEDDPAILSPDEVRAIMAYAASDKIARPFLPGLVLATFCGVRPAELARLRFADLCTEGREELYLSRTLTKTKRARRAKLRANVIAWMKYASGQGLAGAPADYILPGSDERRRRDKYTRFLSRLAGGAGVTIPRDALRHTAATMISALDGMTRAAEELGNDIRTLLNHYRHSVPEQMAQEFFCIMPPG